MREGETMSRLVAYPAILDDSENEKNIFSVSFPDVPDALTFGNGIAEAITKAEEALGLSLDDLNKLPRVSDLNEIREKNKSKIVSFVAVDLDEVAQRVIVPTVRKNTTLPADIAQEAEKRNINFSEVLLQGLKEKLNS